MSKTQIRVPVQPILDHIKHHGGELSAFFEQEEVVDQKGEFRLRVVDAEKTLYNRVAKRLERATEQGWMDYFLVDELCIDQFRLHPALVFGPAWWDIPNDKALQDRLAGRNAEKEAA